ncbi:MAG: tRNA preQ1(34) S-adenosylmethionine ribosyltransferase-isomerase QueA [Proteobacteria bacterium]|nr:tRNA preQ1(34) S-adenosylmethionine ribosyltransferase-isomerase QueA [Pseudomonadota bacterium]
MIAAHPARPRDSARLLEVGDRLIDRVVADLPELLAPGDVLVVNDTRVLPARLDGVRRGAAVEVTLHKREAPGRWRAFARPGRRLHVGDTIEFAPGFAAAVAGRGPEGDVVLQFGGDDAALFHQLETYGRMPLPPYIRRAAEPDPRDREDYQTLFATHAGAVAAPTAGLHFTGGLMAGLHERGVATVALTLHVGAGTFLPVRTEEVRQHRMHAEYGEIAPSAAVRINQARAAGGRVVAVGTTSLRLLEAAIGPDGTLAAFAGETDIFITPGYTFRMADLLLTNFHLPRSTLFMLVCAFAGTERMRAAYAHAIAAGYRFYSYGDCCLLRRAAPEGAR